MPGRLRDGVVIVMPALAEREHGDPEAVSGSIAGDEALRAPHVRCGIYEPRAVQAVDRPEEHAPQQVGHSAEGEQENAEHHLWNPVPLADPNVEFVFSKVGNVREQGIEFVVHGLSREDPTDVGPESAVIRRVRVALLVRILVMNAVRGHPENGSAFERERPANGQKILDPFRGFVPAMREQAVVAHADAQTAGNPPKHNCREKRLPAKKEKRSHGSNMKRDHEESRDRIHRLGKCFVALQSLEHSLSPFLLALSF